MKIIGICGTSGAGKSTVSRIFENYGIPVLDCDEIYHELVDAPSECLTEIGETFGNHFVEKGYLDRKELGKIVFADRGKLNLLNEISHRHVVAVLERRIKDFLQDGAIACIIDAPMLFEAGLDQRCDAVIAVTADENIQLKRICARDGISIADAKKRLSNQTPSAELINKADYFVENNESQEDLLMQISNIYKLILDTKGE